MPPRYGCRLVANLDSRFLINLSTVEYKADNHLLSGFQQKNFSVYHYIKIFLLFFLRILDFYSRHPTSFA